jgi:ribonuclease HII
MKILGIDEAGKGPIIGPMIICGVLVKKGKMKDIENLGLKDSKELNHKKRIKFAKIIPKYTNKILIRIIKPNRIDKENINLIELKTTVELIKKTKPDEVYIDVPTNPKGVKNYIKNLKHLLKDKNIKIIGCNKADKKYKVVSCASIIAKVKREEIIKRLKKKYGDFGSGYLSDKKTINFVRKKDKECKIIRKKWKIKKLEDKLTLFNI